MKYCSQCRTEMQDADKFCMKCGSVANIDKVEQKTASVHGTAGSPKSASQINNSDNVSQLPEVTPQVDHGKRERGSGLRTRLILGAILAIILVAGGFWGWNTYGTKAQVEKELDLAVKYLSDNNYEQAILAFNDAIKIDSKEVKGYQGLARTYTLQGNFDEAKSTYEKGIAIVTSQNKQTLQLGLAGMYIDQNKLSEAQQAYSQIINTSPDCREAYWGLAMVYKQQGDNSKAEAILRQAVDKNPKECRGYNTIALFLSQNNKQDEALNIIVQSLSLEINQQEAYLVLDIISQNNWSTLRSKTSGLSDQTVAAMLEFYSYYSAADYANAINIYQNKLYAQTSNQKAKILSAICMLKNGDKVSAETLIKQINVSKLNAWLLGDLGRYYLASGDQVKAKDYAVKALQSNPTNLDAISLLQLINSNDAKIYTAKVLLYNWRPLDSIHEELQLYEININMLASQKNNSDKNLDSASGTTKLEDNKNLMNSESGTSPSEPAHAQTVAQSVLNSGMFQWRGVKVGMTERQVTTLIGAPDEELKTQTGSHWRYGEINVTWQIVNNQPVVKCIGWFKTIDNAIFSGDSYEKLIAIYGQPSRLEEQDYSEGDFYAIYENHFGMVKFLIIQGRVKLVGIGNIYYV